MLADCAVVYVLQIGGRAAARLVAKKIHPIKGQEEQTIAAVIEQLQDVLRNNPPLAQKSVHDVVALSSSLL